MSKQRYNILRLALGVFLGMTLARFLQDPSAMSGSDYMALGVGLFAGVVNYWPEPKGTKHEDRS